MKNTFLFTMDNIQVNGDDPLHTGQILYVRRSIEEKGKLLMISFRLILMWIFCRSRRRTTSCSIRRYFPHRGSKSPSVAGIFISSNRFISENVEQGADKDVGGGEDPEVLQKVPQKEISAEGIKKEGFHFYFVKKDDSCNVDLHEEVNDGDGALSESGHKGAMEEAHRGRRLCSITSISLLPHQIRSSSIQKIL